MSYEGVFFPQFQFKRTGDFITTITGSHIYPMAKDQSVNQYTLFDTAHGLSRICRFNGHVKDHLSVGYHVLTVVEIVAYLGGNELEQLWALHHDDSESFFCDIPSPIKPYLLGYEEQEKLIQEAILKTFGIPIPTPDQYRIVKQADLIALHNEALVMTKHSQWADPTARLEFLDYKKITKNKVRKAYIKKHEELMLACKSKGLL
jgi:5'-deoxynucleotidase YfbR-like HD superfamily hydrolase